MAARRIVPVYPRWTCQFRFRQASPYRFVYFLGDMTLAPTLLGCPLGRMRGHMALSEFFLRCVCLTLAWGADGLAERVQREAPPAWSAYESWAERVGVQGSWRSLYKELGPPDRTFVNRTTLARFNSTNHCGLSIKQHEPTAGVTESDGTLEAANGVYAFRLTRPNASAPWVLDRVVRLTEPSERPKGFLVTPRTWCREIHKAPFSIFNRGISLLDALRDPDCRVVKATELPGTDLVKLEFVTQPKKKPSGWWDPLKGGTVTLEPRRHWVINSFDLQLEFDNGRQERLHGSYTYQEVEAGGIVPARLDFISTSGKTVIHWLTEFSLTAGGPADQREFRLSYYGFPEPFGVEWERPIPWGLYIIGGTLGMVFVMGVVWRIRRWRAAA